MTQMTALVKTVELLTSHDGAEVTAGMVISFIAVVLVDETSQDHHQ
jgi:hypothetical protein